MTAPTPRELDPALPIAVDEGVWWVGHYVEGDAFQCHAYLVETADGGVLLDPGSVLTWPSTRAKIQQIMPLDQVRWVVAHHQDPDVIGALRDIEADLPGPVTVITHWRIETIIHSYGATLPLLRVEEHDWTLTLGGRRFDFVFTPYAHFPGAFCTFDGQTGTLFSSDLFGAFTEGFQLYAEAPDYLAQVLPFHQHYMPGREVLMHAMARIRQHPVRRIAPQHGSIIEGDAQVTFLCDRLSELECGLYLLADVGKDIARISKVRGELTRLTRTVLGTHAFADVIASVADSVGELLPLDLIEVFAHLDDASCLHFEPLSQYRGRVKPQPAHLMALASSGGVLNLVTLDGAPALLVPLASCDDATAGGLPGGALPVAASALLVVRLRAAPDARQPALTEDAAAYLTQAREVLLAAVSKAAELRALELQRTHWIERSMRDELTGLYNRLYLHVGVKQLLEQARRSMANPLALLMVDLDHFKHVNDTYGHVAGDQVLAAVGGAIRGAIRQVDIPVRLGGEEFAVFTGGNRNALTVAQRIHTAIGDLRFDGDIAALRITASIGVAHFQADDTLETLTTRADARLYTAKRAGRDRISVG